MARSEASAASGKIAPLSREPVHVVYGGAHLFRADTCTKLGGLARRALTEYAPDADSFSSALDISSELSETVYSRVSDKLRQEPIEDYRIDFEDGYGFRSESEEDEAAYNAARETARAMAKASLPPFFGIRIKPLNPEWKRRALSTLWLYLDELFSKTVGRLPPNFVVTLPKITAAQQVAELAAALEAYPGIGIELMIETPESLSSIAELIQAAKGRCTAAHFGPYDYTASLGIAASRQGLSHPACDFARSTMQIQFARTGIRLSDGPTTLLPIPPHHGALLSSSQITESRNAVHKAWKLHYDNVGHALDNGFYQGWDLHPAQLPARFAAVYAFFLDGLEADSERLRNFIAQAAQATRVGGIFDDAATGQALLYSFRRATQCGAITEEEALARTGLQLEQMRRASFQEIIQSVRD